MSGWLWSAEAGGGGSGVAPNRAELREWETFSRTPTA